MKVKGPKYMRGIPQLLQKKVMQNGMKTRKNVSACQYQSFREF